MLNQIHHQLWFGKASWALVRGMTLMLTCEAHHGEMGPDLVMPLSP